MKCDMSEPGCHLLSCVGMAECKYLKDITVSSNCEFYLEVAVVGI